METLQQHEDLDLSTLHEHLTQSLVIVNRMRSRQGTTFAAGEDEFRRYKGGPLSEKGVEKMIGFFESGMGDSAIALAMKVSLAGVSRRRTMWRRDKQK